MVCQHRQLGLAELALARLRYTSATQATGACQRFAHHWYAQVPEGGAVVTFEWGDEGSLAVDAVDAAHEGAPAAEASEPLDASTTQVCRSASTFGWEARGRVSELDVQHGRGHSTQVHARTRLQMHACVRAGEGVQDGDERLAHQRWQGREVALMRGNEHSSERRGAWAAEGLEGAARALVEGDRDAARRAACCAASFAFPGGAGRAERVEMRRAAGRALSSHQTCSLADASGLHAAAHMGRLQGCHCMPTASCLVMKACVRQPARWAGALRQCTA